MSSAHVAAIVSAAIVVIVLSKPAENGLAGSFDEYEFQTCITYCYANFSPSRRPGEHASCVMRCKRRYEKDEYDSLLPRKEPQSGSH